MTLQSDPDQSMRGQVAMDDDAILDMITNREQKGYNGQKWLADCL